MLQRDAAGVQPTGTLSAQALCLGRLLMIDKDRLAAGEGGLGAPK